MAILPDITHTIGRTPLIGLRQLDKGLPATILLKLEYLNPLGSLKDRIALKMIEEGEASGKLKPGMTIIEATNGNTGIALAAIGIARGYPVTIVMSEAMSIERRAMLLMLGAKLILTPAELGLRGALAKVKETVDEDPDNTYVINQGVNIANPLAHHETAEEIWQDTAGKVDMLVIGVGTGGMYKGMYDYFKKKNANVELVAVEPAGSALNVPIKNKPFIHRIPGIGPGVPPPHMNDVSMHAVEKVTDEEALQMVKVVIAKEGIPIGISSGAAICVALRLAKREENAGKTIITIVTSQVERYFSTHFAETEWKSAMNITIDKINPTYLKLVELEYGF